jgi:eukaryotic-like serine/threonine-protein kinase
VIVKIVKIAFFALLFFLSAGISAYMALTYIIKSGDTVIVPDLTGKDLVYSLEILTDLGLNTKVSGSEYNEIIPKNHIIFQDPEPGSEIKKDRDVRIAISKGPQTIVMPNLEGLSIQQARIIAEENGLCQGKLSVAYSKTFIKDIVMAQAPLPGKIVTRETCIDILLSNGIQPVQYMMPDLTGTTLDETIRLLESLNLTIGDIQSTFDISKPKNRIVSQNPLPGYQVVENSIVNLVMNREPGSKSHNLINETGGVQLFQFKLEIGLMRKHIQIDVNCFGVTVDLVDQYAKPGEEIWTLIPRNLDATLFLYQDNELIKTEVFDTW